MSRTYIGGCWLGDHHSMLTRGWSIDRLVEGDGRPRVAWVPGGHLPCDLGLLIWIMKLLVWWRMRRHLNFWNDHRIQYVNWWLNWRLRRCREKQVLANKIEHCLCSSWPTPLIIGDKTYRAMWLSFSHGFKVMVSGIVFWLFWHFGRLSVAYRTFFLRFEIIFFLHIGFFLLWDSCNLTIIIAILCKQWGMGSFFGSFLHYFIIVIQVGNEVPLN